MKALTLARHEALKIGDDITLTARHDGGQVQIVIDAPECLQLARVRASTDFANAKKIQWQRMADDKAYRN